MKPTYRKAVFVLGYSIKKGKPEYILLKRKLHWKGWEFAKGKIEKNEKKRDTAKRELREETGLSPVRGKIKRFNFSGKYNYNRIFPDRPGFKGQTFSLYAAQVKRGKVRISKKEHSGHKWVDFSRALKMVKFPNQKKSLKIVNSWILGK